MHAQKQHRVGEVTTVEAKVIPVAIKVNLRDSTSDIRHEKDIYQLLPRQTGKYCSLCFFSHLGNLIL